MTILISIITIFALAYGLLGMGVYLLLCFAFDEDYRAGTMLEWSYAWLPRLIDILRFGNPRI